MIGRTKMKSIKTKFFIEKFFYGLNAFSLGIWQYAMEHNRDSWWIDLICGIVILGYFIFHFIVSPKLRFEPVDEMTKNHEHRAQAAVYIALCTILSLFGVLCLAVKRLRFMVSFNLSWTHLFVILGFLQIAEYICFLLIERSGDTIE